MKGEIYMVTFTMKDYYIYKNIFSNELVLNEEKEKYELENIRIHQYQDKIFKEILSNEKKLN